MMLLTLVVILCQDVNSADVSDTEAEKIAKEVLDNALKSAASENLNDRIENTQQGTFDNKEY